MYDDDDDDESPFTSSPNDFLLSIYKENPSKTKLDDTSKTTLSYKCRSCRKRRENPILTCAQCVNTGQFCASNHETCSNKRRNALLNILNTMDHEASQHYSNSKSTHLLCSDRLYLLKKVNSQKDVLQSEFQTKTKSSIEIHQMSERIQLRRNRLQLVQHTIKILRDQIERKKEAQLKTIERINDARERVTTIKGDLNDNNEAVQLAKNGIKRKMHTLRRQENILNQLRRECFDQLLNYIFPVKQVSAIEEDLATRIKDLLNAQQTTTDEMNNERVDDDDDDAIVNVAEYRYQIVNSCLSSTGDYQIDNLLNTTNANTHDSDPESPQSSLSHDLYEVLSALSHACQLINVIAFYLHIHLPFRLHQLEFNTNNLTIDCLRADIAKLNTNIISTCLSQDIPIQLTNVTYTLENLLKLLRLERYRNRPSPVIYSQSYIDILERDVNELSRALVTDYWFDDDDDKDVPDLLNDDEWEAVPQHAYIPSDPSISDQSDSSPSTSSQQHSSMMSSSLDYFKAKSSGVFDSFARTFKS